MTSFRFDRWAIALIAGLALIGCDDGEGTDAGPPDTDAGPPGMDAGPGDTDAGPGNTDAGPGDTDAGPGDVDAGPPVMGNDFVYFFGDYATDGAANVGRFDIGAMTAADLMPEGLVDATTIRDIAVSPDGTRLAVSGQPMAGGPLVINVYAADGTGTAVNVFTAPAAGRFTSDLAFSPDGTRLAWTGPFETMGMFDDDDEALYVALADGTGTPTRVSHDVPANNQGVNAFVWVDNANIAFSGDTVDNNLDEIFAVEVTVPGAPAQLVPPAIRAMFSNAQDVVGATLALDSVGRLYFRADFVTNNLFHLYRVGTDGMGFEEVPGTGLMRGAELAEIDAFGISSDGAQLAFSTNATDANVSDIYVLPLTGTTATQVSSFTIADNSFVQGPDFNDLLQFSPDGSMLAFAADYALNAGEPNASNSVFVVPTTGTGGTRLFGVPTDAALDATSVVWSTDSAWVFARADFNGDSDSDLFGTSDLNTADQPLAGVTRVDAPAGGDVFGMVPASLP